MADHHLALIRHGAYHQRAGAPSALQPYPLTNEGAQQARDCGTEIAQLLEGSAFRLDSVVHSSCQLRAWQTARIASDVLLERGFEITEIHQSPALSERSVGSAANLTLEEIEAVLAEDPRFDTPPPGWKSDSDYRLPLQGAESMTMAGTRVAGYLRHIVETASTNGHAPLLTLIFGHGASFRHAARNLGVLRRSDIPKLSMYHARPLRLCYNQDGSWAHSGGHWKQRRGGEIATD
ncbi:histidine phosphatase family protein [Tropicimonas sediminicola]|uniref:phosphoglycerate mutase (2,3-diphosphoglycerate-dependent) n=1 Tax=Tropicimonas sediminicola TaxID=1031541 RepID=A0A239LCM1_9RHOB|nr:histidine phosphatase family protein [Tropicimonas sediminicola]SNT28040.1 2,3-bisphosphoglycerate-dependent phosphoglycerate mutase [Tropicimonas sediminicola]